MEYTIAYYSESVQEQILDLPDTLAARFIVLTRRMVAIGPNLGEPHTKAFGDGPFFRCGSKVLRALLVCFSARRLENVLSSCTVLSKNQLERLCVNLKLPTLV